MANNFRKLPGETIILIYPLDEMRAYDSLPIELRQAVARANVRLHASTVVKALGNVGAVRVIEIIDSINRKSQANYEAACLAELEALEKSTFHPSDFTVRHRRRY